MAWRSLIVLWVSLLLSNRWDITFTTYTNRFFLVHWTFLCMFLLLPVAEPITRAGPFRWGPLHDNRPKAPHVHTTIWSPSIPHGPQGLPWFCYARAGLSSHVWPNGSTARLPHDEDAGPACAQTNRGGPQPAQHTTHAAPAPASVPTGSWLSRLYWYIIDCLMFLVQLRCLISGSVTEHRKGVE